MSEALEANANLAEIRRLQTELAGVRDELAQRDRAIVAAHRAIELVRAELDAARAVIDAARAATRLGLFPGGGDVVRALGAYDQATNPPAD